MQSKKVTAVAYYAGIPVANKNKEKPLILDYFCQGVTAAGDVAVAHTGHNVLPCEVALIQGFVHNDGKDLPHLRLRKSVLDFQRTCNRRTLIVDSNLFLFADQSNPFHYLRYSFDGVFPNTGYYFDANPDPSRWQNISRDLGIELKPWRTAGTHILICLQRNGGWSMGGVSVIAWLNSMISTIRSYSQRPIVIRPHPGDKKINSQLQLHDKNVYLSKHAKFTDDLRDCWATVVYNSSPSVASVVQGVPTFVTDPIGLHSQSFAVANHHISNIESPQLPDRQAWIEQLCMSHWKFDELKSGAAWQFFKRHL